MDELFYSNGVSANEPSPHRFPSVPPLYHHDGRGDPPMEATDGSFGGVGGRDDVNHGDAFYQAQTPLDTTGRSFETDYINNYAQLNQPSTDHPSHAGVPTDRNYRGATYAMPFAPSSPYTGVRALQQRRERQDDEHDPSFRPSETDRSMDALTSTTRATSPRNTTGVHRSKSADSIETVEFGHQLSTPRVVMEPHEYQHPFSHPGAYPSPAYTSGLQYSVGRPMAPPTPASYYNALPTGMPFQDAGVTIDGLPLRDSPQAGTPQQSLATSEMPPALPRNRASATASRTLPTRTATAAPHKSRNIGRRKHTKPSVEDMQNATTPRSKAALRMWYLRLNDLWKFKKEHGHCKVPQKYPENAPLGIWVNKQRMEYKNRINGGPNKLTDSKIAALVEVGFEWAKPKGDLSWNHRYSELAEYYHEHGDCLVPTKSKENPALGRWVSTQRSQYKRWKGEEDSSMTQDRADKLDAIGFVWSVATP